VDKFVRFVNLMINDVTYLMNESLSELTQIHDIQSEMENTAVWSTKPLDYRREREQTLRQLEQHASGYTTLGRSTVALLKDFTAETTTPFMMPEIVDRLAAMLDYNLDALAGPKCQNLVVKDPEKLKFSPKTLLSDILQIFLNLSDQEDFVRAVAGDGRSYRKELFDRASSIARDKALKSSSDLETLSLFVAKVEVAKAALKEEDEIGDIPEEFLG
jgi:ubiquitin conjugation factor E4 B